MSENSYKPTKAMQIAAEQGLKWRKEFKRGGTLVGVARARDIINGKNLPIRTIARMFSFFSRHLIDKQGQGWNIGEEGYPSNGKIAWYLWGGDAGYTWSSKIWKKYKKQKKNTLNFDYLMDSKSSDDIIDAVIKLYTE